GRRAVTVTLWSRREAWITRTSDLPLGVVSRSWSTASRSPLAGPSPATVYAAPGATRTLADRTGGEVAFAPAPRMATVYSPLASFSYGGTVPQGAWPSALPALRPPHG